MSRFEPIKKEIAPNDPSDLAGAADALWRQFAGARSVEAFSTAWLALQCRIVDGVNGGGAMNTSFYGESFIPSAYAARAYSEWFSMEDFIFDPSRQSHPVMFFRKK